MSGQHVYTGSRHTLSMEAYYTLVHSDLGHADPRLDDHGTPQVTCILTMM
jgi:hypothetical protein